MKVYTKEQVFNWMNMYEHLVRTKFICSLPLPLREHAWDDIDAALEEIRKEFIDHWDILEEDGGNV